jgi:SAM-dependent methyltransferase
MLTVTPTSTGRDELMRLLVTKWITPVIGVLADLGVADELVAGPRTAEELAGSVGAHPVALRRLLRAAVSIGVFTTDGADDRFALNAAAECLRSDAPDGLRAAATVFALEPFWAPYARIRHSVTTGEPAFDEMFGMSVYDYLATQPDKAALFGAAAATFHAEAIARVAAEHDFTAYGTVVDVGGGTGTLLASVLRRHPGVRGVLFDLPDVVDAARATFEPDLRLRVELVAGDFFREVPPGDAFLLKSCLHNFADDRAVDLLRAIRRAAPDGGRLLVAETVVPFGAGPHYAKLDDVEMLVIAGGADRDEHEYARLLDAAGFTVRGLVPCGARFSLIEAVAA